ncbi:hypothetical protein HYPSUDRAFT_59699 [Hypholoma sublateritium FD-334 SS-4]|uniref:Uncharacterized protein n=1 Tax=Hypholoma sublateritium (strain FD-334 SS-4) TaxID=945553 RepID=A0A0D2NB76_HYPSF|nr:hypothetical protein HYPSUDRAFT_59699 [Hypholoma sublateritium FD-334 SS-4]
MTSCARYVNVSASTSERASLAFGPSTSSSTTTNNTRNDAFGPPSFSPGFAQGFGHPTLAQRTSLSFGLGRRASSAQPLLMRVWGAGVDADDVFTHPFSADHAALFAGSFSTAFGVAPGERSVGVQGERDHSPLPDVEPELFAPDFSFGGSSSSTSGSSAASSVGVPPGGMDGAVSPVSPIPVPPTVVAEAGAYEGSPLAGERCGTATMGAWRGFMHPALGRTGCNGGEIYHDGQRMDAQHLDGHHLDPHTQRLDVHSQYPDPYGHAQGMYSPRRAARWQDGHGQRAGHGHGRDVLRQRLPAGCDCTSSAFCFVVVAILGSYPPTRRRLHLPFHFSEERKWCVEMVCCVIPSAGVELVCSHWVLPAATQLE